eukprot:TRINITY_DN3600_c0_g4_i1.p1 TRINITY_DN3600_c0_g4~~TRINITY_DN3600_c0_g4_i1.p1  ORF type:complete len:497 (+),score=200.64 TRINITY_DN3600_c0_g4_i1:49-1491(+)
MPKLSQSVPAAPESEAVSGSDATQPADCSAGRRGGEEGLAAPPTVAGVDSEAALQLPTHVFVTLTKSEKFVLRVSRTWRSLTDFIAAAAQKTGIAADRVVKATCADAGSESEATLLTLDDLSIFSAGAEVHLHCAPRQPRPRDDSDDGPPSVKRRRLPGSPEPGGVVTVTDQAKSLALTVPEDAAVTDEFLPPADLIVKVGSKMLRVNKQMLATHSTVLQQLLESGPWADSDQDTKVLNLSGLMASASVQAVVAVPELLRLLVSSTVPPLETRDLKQKLAIFEAADALCMKDLEMRALHSIQNVVLSGLERASVQEVCDRLNHQGLRSVLQRRQVEEYLMSCIKNAVTDPSKHRTFAFSVICGYVNSGGSNLINLMAECLDDGTLDWEVSDVEFVTGLIDDSSCVQVLENADVSRAVPLLASGRIGVEAVAEFTCYCFTKGIMNSKDILQRIWIPMGIPSACPAVVECWPLANTIMSSGW